jgi:hypothetical protein
MRDAWSESLRHYNMRRTASQSLRREGRYWEIKVRVVQDKAHQGGNWLGIVTIGWRFCITRSAQNRYVS